MSIHPSAVIHGSAVVEPGAVVGEGAVVGPFALIGPEVTLGARVVVKSHAVVTGWTEIGDDCVIFPFATVGEVPQDLKYRGERARLEIGQRNRIREYVTMNPGTEGGGGVTRVGDDGLFMAGSHVAHDCQIGDRVILVNNASVAGHCVLEDDVIIGGLSGEVDIVPQLLMEMVDHIRAGKMNALAVLMDQPFKLSGAADIPAITASVPDIKPYLPMGESFGIMVPKDTPAHVVKAIDEAFKIAVKSDTVKKFAAEKGSVVLALSGDEAQAHVAKLSSIVSWTLFDGGTAKISPEKFGFPRLK